MIEFHAPTPADKAWVDELLARGNYRGCDYNFTNLYVWSRAYNQRIARVDDFLVTHVCGRLGCSYMYPAGSGDIAAVIRALEADAAEKGSPCAWVPHAPADGGAGGIFPRPVRLHCRPERLRLPLRGGAAGRAGARSSTPSATTSTAL